MAIDIILFIFIVFCAYSDWKYRKVFNSSVVSAVVLGFGMNFFYGGLPGLGRSFIGLATGFSFLFVFYLLGGMGAGDVKFMAAVGCLKGLNFVLIGGLYGAVLGGVAAIVIMLFERRLVRTVKRIFISLFMLVTFRSTEVIKVEAGKAAYLPYTIFLSLGLTIRWVEITYFLSSFTR